LVYRNAVRNQQIEEIIKEITDWHLNYLDIVERFNKIEELRNWEPKVRNVRRAWRKRRKELIIGEYFTIMILMNVFFRGYDSYYFDRRCQDCLEAKTKFEAVKIDIEISDWLRIWYESNGSTRNEALEMLEKIDETLKEELSPSEKYDADENNPGVEIWRWNLVVPVWRLIFECKRIQIDQRLEKEKQLNNKTIPANTVEEKRVVKTNNNEKGVVVDRRKPEPIELKVGCK
jgi:hypothetical protein